MFTKILLATDGSSLSRKAEDCAISLARVHRAELVVVHVVPRYPTSCFEGAASFSAEEVGAIESRVAHEALQMLANIAQRAADANIKTRTIAPSNDHVAQALLQAARKHRCDLIVMASHGRKGLPRLLLGSETEHVLTHSNLPVLVLR